MNTSDLQDRAKELNCLYQVDEALHVIDKEITEAISDLLDIIPNGWRYSDLCEAEIILGDQIYSRAGLQRTELKQTALIKAYGEIIGEIRVYYTRPVKSDRGIFIAGEMQMLQSIAEKIAMFVTLKKLKPSNIEDETTPDDTEMLKRLQHEYPDMMEWLKNLGLKKREAVQVLRNPLNFRKGETIGKQGAFTSYFILLAKGATKSYIEGPSSKSYSFMLTLPYDFIAMSSLFGKLLFFDGCINSLHCLSD